MWPPWWKGRSRRKRSGSPRLQRAWLYPGKERASQSREERKWSASYRKHIETKKPPARESSCAGSFLRKEKQIETDISFAIYNKWYAFIPSADILNADYVDFFVKAENTYRATTTDIKRVTVDHLDDVSELLSCMGKVTVEENFIGARWSKLLINSAFSGLSTVTGETFGFISRDRRMRRVAQRIIKECIDVAKSAGIAIEPVQGHRIDRLFGYRGPLKRAISFALIPVAMKKHAGLISSMLQDLRAGKQCEIDFINGVVCEFGKMYGVETPFDRRVVELVHAIEAGELSISPENIRRFDDLLK